MSFQLSQDQNDAIRGICDIFLDINLEKHALAVLTGSAGVGKTTVVAEIIEALRANSPGLNIELCASTHRAAGVLQNIVGGEVSTGHSLFKLRPSITKYGKETLKSTGPCLIPNGSVVIIDESSMLGNIWLKAVVETIKDRHLKILFVGDPYQLAPPKDVCSIFDGSLPTFTLTKVHRQDIDNPILNKAIEYRDFIRGVRATEPTLSTDLNELGQGIQMLEHADFVSGFVKRYINYVAGEEVDVPLCTFTNESAINYNSMIRKAAYFLGDTILPFYEGERLVSNAIVKNGDRVALNNNESVTVISYSTADHKGIPGYNVKVQGSADSFNRSGVKTVFCPATKAAADKILDIWLKDAKSTKSSTNWIQYYELKNSLADLRPPFAGTTHKAQGGTYHAVFIDRVNINKCHDPITRARLMYVALTRASTNAYVNT
jgi:hypothetical protein